MKLGIHLVGDVDGCVDFWRERPRHLQQLPEHGRDGGAVLREVPHGLQQHVLLAELGLVLGAVLDGFSLGLGLHRLRLVRLNLGL